MANRSVSPGANAGTQAEVSQSRRNGSRAAYLRTGSLRFALFKCGRQAVLIVVYRRS